MHKQQRFALVMMVVVLVGLCRTLGTTLDLGRARVAAPLPTLGINREGVAAIESRMRLSQVVTILVAPPGSYRTADVGLDLDSPEALQQQDDFFNIMNDIDYLLGNTWYESKYWAGNAGTVWVCFDKHGQVAATGFIPVRPVR